jgi:hypothetical protein
MFKRTRGYIVLTLLIITGLASQVSTPTITSNERKLVISRLKESKKHFLASIDGLSEKQMSYKPTGMHSIKEYCGLLDNYTKITWGMAKTALQLPGKKECRMSEAACLKMSGEMSNKSCCTKSCTLANINANGGITARLKERQVELIRYAKTTTEDLHGNMIETPAGKMDIYEAMLSISSKTNETTEVIRRIKSQPGFPALK